MKNILLISIIILTIGCSEDTLTPRNFGKKFYESLKSKKNVDFDDQYLTKNEFERLMDNAIIFRQSDEQLRDLYTGWNNDKINFFSNFQMEINDNYKKIMSESKLDSITYSYLKPKRGKDELINWPDSKNYQIKSNELITTSISVYFSESNSSYLLTLNPMSFNKKWKFWKECEKPKLEKLN